MVCIFWLWIQVMMAWWAHRVTGRDNRWLTRVAAWLKVPATRAPTQGRGRSVASTRFLFDCDRPCSTVRRDSFCSSKALPPRRKWRRFAGETRQTAVYWGVERCRKKSPAQEFGWKYTNRRQVKTNPHNYPHMSEQALDSTTQFDPIWLTVAGSAQHCRPLSNKLELWTNISRALCYWSWSVMTVTGCRWLMPCQRTGDWCQWHHESCLRTCLPSCHVTHQWTLASVSQEHRL